MTSIFKHDEYDFLISYDDRKKTLNEIKGKWISKQRYKINKNFDIDDIEYKNMCYIIKELWNLYYNKHKALKFSNPSTINLYQNKINELSSHLNFVVSEPQLHSLLVRQHHHY
jgi:6-pyruvoyl-tetrahydropterin synthase